MTKNPPALEPNELSIKVVVDIPDLAFKRTAFEGSIIVNKADLETVEKLEFELKRLKETK